MTRADWAARLPAEILFWDGWLGARGNIWGLDPKIFTDALDHNLPLQPHLVALLHGQEQQAGGGFHILDVGSGPLTTVGKRWGMGAWYVPIHLTACDALAREYGDLCALHKIVPLVPVHCVDAEALDTLYAPDSFDLVHCTNALDHTYDPVRAIDAMLNVTKPGGAIYLRHHQRTADFEHGIGLHQWNFFHAHGQFWIVPYGDERKQRCITAAIHPRATATTRFVPGAIPDVEVIIRKRT